VTLRLPIGIVGAISPFNFPLNLVAHKVAPALAAGCPVVLKPASTTPLSALFLANLEEEAGLPPGWLNVVAGSASEIGDVLVEDERVKLITFTGSGGVGNRRARAPKRVKLSLETPPPRSSRRRTRHAASSLRTRSRSPARADSVSASSSSTRPQDSFVAEFVPKVRRGRRRSADEATTSGR
jgi:hypothetical protein